MKRDILTKRIDGGWSSPCGRVRALRGTSLLDSVRSGNAVVMGVGRMTFWTVELLNLDGTLNDDESVDTLAEADEQAWWFKNRIDEGRA